MRRHSIKLGISEHSGQCQSVGVWLTYHLPGQNEWAISLLRVQYWYPSESLHSVSHVDWLLFFSVYNSHFTSPGDPSQQQTGARKTHSRGHILQNRGALRRQFQRTWPTWFNNDSVCGLCGTHFYTYTTPFYSFQGKSSQMVLIICRSTYWGQVNQWWLTEDCGQWDFGQWPTLLFDFRRRWD